MSGRARAFLPAVSSVFFLGMLTQVVRYRRASGTTVREQAKWAMAPLGVLGR